MKKKILIVIIVFLLLLVLIVSFTTSGFLKDSISFVTIENGFLSDKIDLLSQVESEIKYQFFNGYVIELYVDKSDRVNKDDKLLQYYDNYGNKKTLYSQNAGIVSDICDRYISLYEDNYYLLADVAIEKYNQIQLNDKGFFYINNICYQTTVIEKTNQVKQINGKDYYQIKLTLPVKDLLLKQSILVSLYSDEKQGLIVDRNAIYQNEKGSFLIKENFSNDLTNLSDYLVPVEILASNGQYCLVNTTLKSGQRVCVIDQKLMEVIES